MSSAKRTSDHLDCEQPPAKRIHPFFTNKPHTDPSTAPFQWLDPLGPTRSCLHGINRHPTSSTKLAAFDLDGTLIKSDYGGGRKPSGTWEWWRVSVPAKLKEVADSGYAVVIISNQALKPQALKTWKAKIPLIAAALPNVPFRLFAATAKDGYRKPMPGMWTELVRIFREDGVEIVSPVLPTSTPLLPQPPAKELVLFVGYPCLGKSTFYRRHFEPAGYIHINQDTLKTRDRCVKETRKALQEGNSCVIDNTNRNIATRKFYLDIAKELDIPARCFHFTGSIELAWHNNLYRTYNLPSSIAAGEHKRELVPYLGFTGFRDNFEEPQLKEGFTEIKKVNWVFNGNEEERVHWSMWLQIDGK
ncbi:hypothetical protein C0995_010597 [Termitomyces sp. Mi166|nr:hypothetical protein C0995_010597 [Termitomyces sp. Mi166\